MTCVINNTARQYNLRCIKPHTVKKAGGSTETFHRRTVVRLVPGFNDVDEGAWNELCKADSKGKLTEVDPYVKDLLDKRLITIGQEAEDAELDQEPEKVVKSKVKVEKVPPNYYKKEKKTED